MANGDLANFLNSMDISTDDVWWGCAGSDVSDVMFFRVAVSKLFGCLQAFFTYDPRKLAISWPCRTVPAGRSSCSWTRTKQG